MIVEEKVESDRWIMYFDNDVNVSWNGVGVVIIFLSIKTIPHLNQVEVWLHQQNNWIWGLHSCLKSCFENKDKEVGCLWRFNANHFLSEMRMID